MRTSRLAGAAAVILLAPGLAGCDGSGLLRHNQLYLSPLYDARVPAAVGGRDLLVEVQGNPFGTDPTGFAQAVTDAMQGHTGIQPPHFTTAPGDTWHRLYRVVVAFNPAEAVGQDELCARTVATAPAAGGVVVYGAFCEGRRALSSAANGAPPVADAQAPDFRRMMAALTRDLFPLENRETRDTNAAPGPISR